MYTRHPRQHHHGGLGAFGSGRGRAFARRYLDVEGGADFTRRFIRAALASVSDTAVIPMPDWLGLGAEARINTPSTLGGNWLWRMDPAALTDALAADILALTKLYGRC